MKVIIWGSGKLGCAAAEYLEKHGVEYCVKTKNAPMPPRGDVIMDFSAPEALDEVLCYAVQNRLPLVIGVTGHTRGQIESIRAAAEHIPVVYESNFSRGIFALKRCLALLKRLLPDWQSAIVELHREEKKDAPSGTALALNSVLSANEIHSIRLGQEKGTHQILLFGDGEKLTLTHTADSLDAFISGAFLACRHILNMDKGLVTFGEILEN